MEAPESPGPSARRLLVMSVAVFMALVVVGGVLGWLAGLGNTVDGIDLARGNATEVEAIEIDVNDVTSTTSVPVPFTTVLDIVDAEPESVPDTTVAPVQVFAVTELDLELGTSTTTEVRDAQVAEIVELPKAVYDTFILDANEVLAINVAANDKVGGQLEAVRPTELGELPPGFTLETSGVLSGSSNQCGRWRQQYALVSDNPFVGTSWIDITIDGCGQAG